MAGFCRRGKWQGEGDIIDRERAAHLKKCWGALAVVIFQAKLPYPVSKWLGLNPTSAPTSCWCTWEVTDAGSDAWVLMWETLRWGSWLLALILSALGKISLQFSLLPVMGSTRLWPKYLSCCTLVEEADAVLVLAWSIHGCCRHLGRDSANGKSLIVSLFPSQISTSYEVTLRAKRWYLLQSSH